MSVVEKTRMVNRNCSNVAEHGPFTDLKHKINPYQKGQDSERDILCVHEGGYVRWVHCHHGMAHPQVADGGKSSGYGG
jgi:hypothetical protein